MKTLSREERFVLLIGLGAASSLLLLGCASESGGGAGFAGSIDTLPSGLISVSNPSEGMWGDGEAWEVVEQVRIGQLDGTGPEVFGAIGSLEIDAAGRFYIHESQANELRVFNSDGEHMRTIGRQGGGPGEFEQVIGMTWAPDGNLWVVDPGNSRISVFDTAGTYIDNHRTIGGFVIMPWPGGFDDKGRFYNYGIDRSAEDGFRTVLVEHSEEMEPVDTIQVPSWTGDENFFELVSENGRGRMRAGVPYSPGLTWRFVRATGYLWFALTGDYEIYQRSLDGDTVRMISREFAPLPVTSEDLDSAVVRLEWFTRQGGKIDHSKFPATKPALQTFFVDDEGWLFVMPVTEAELQGRVLDVFDDTGRYMGRITLPFVLQRYPVPVFRGGFMFGVTEDELEVPYVVRARIGPERSPERGRSRELVGGM